MHDDEKYFLETYKAAAYTIKDRVTEYSATTMQTFPYDDPLRTESIRFVEEGGKRFRPALAYLIAKFYGIDDVVPCLALEYLHKYFLTHDDIIDQDRIRYSEPTVHVKMEELYEEESDIHEHGEKSSNNSIAKWHFGNSIATVAGDMMCADAYRLVLESEISDEKKIHLCKLISVTTEQTVYGWYIQFLMDYMQLADSRLSEERIIESLVWVTGKYTMRFPMLFGYALAGIDVPKEIDTLADDLGILFQTGDDVIGIFGDPEVTQKSNYGDIIQGKKTLPLWFTYRGANGADKQILEHLVGKKDLSKDEAETVRDIVRRSAGLERTKEFMRDYRDRCLAHINEIEMPTDMKRFLKGFAIYLEKREF